MEVDAPNSRITTTSTKARNVNWVAKCPAAILFVRFRKQKIVVLKSVMTGSELCFTVSSLDEVDATVVYEF